jgi:hypothetical protein
MNMICPSILDISVEKPIIKSGTQNYYTFRPTPKLLTRRTRPLTTYSSKETHINVQRRVSRNHLYKTRYCIYRENCSRKDTCLFAHTDEELRDAFCLYGGYCTKRETCQYRHPDETHEDYRIRIDA